MSFIVREAEESDLDNLYALAKQFTLLNLPDDKSVLREKIERSVNSFSGTLKKEECEYLFILEDLENENLVGTSLIMAKHGTPNSPHNFFKIEKRNRFSEDLGVGFIHQVLKFHADTDGPTEIGGLLIDYHYRRRPEKLGRLISLSRFVFMGMYPERFEERVLCELTPPLDNDGRSDFWEALGRRFTGLPYQEADMLSQNHKEFISSLFPEEDIYLTLLESKARLVVGRVGTKTKPAQHLLEKIGFKYTHEVDPFDGGPHYACPLKEISVVAKGKWAKVETKGKPSFDDQALIGCTINGQFRAAASSINVKDGKIMLPESLRKTLGVEEGMEVFYSLID